MIGSTCSRIARHPHPVGRPAIAVHPWFAVYFANNVTTTNFGAIMSKIVSALAACCFAVLATPAFADASCSSAAEASAKNYEHEQGIIWGKMGGTIRDFKQNKHDGGWGSRCLVDVSFKIAHQDNIVTTRFVVDAIQRKIYATFYGIAKKGNEENPRVLTCNYGYNFDEASYCKSEEEFESVVATMVK
jgi:hypothetical protein